MNFNECRNDLPILVIHNVDPSWSESDIEEDQIETQILVEALTEIGHPIRDTVVETADLAAAIRDIPPQDYLVFNWCEELPGVPHSECLVAQELEALGFTFTGAGAEALILSQDKRRVKKLLQDQGIPTPTWQVYTTIQEVAWDRFPAIVKPAFEHCGFGISRQSVVQSKEELLQRVQFVLDDLKQPAIVEDFIDGREFHVGVIGNSHLRVLPPAEIDYSQFDDIHDRLCTYESNFDKNSRAYRLTIPKLPVPLTPEEITIMEQVVLAAFRITSCRDYARMDIRLQDGIFYILDVNHNADISSGNSLIRAADLVGISYGQFGSLLVNLAAERHPVFRKR